MALTSFDTWTAGEGYEHYMGRWSRLTALRFLDWLAPPAQKDWIEIGCGSGALTAGILKKGAPRSLIATDQSAAFIAHCRASKTDPRVRFVITDAQELRFPDGSADVVTSGLVLNFIPDKVAALREMRRVLRPGGSLSFYVWDYPNGGMGLIDVFWKAAAAIDPDAAGFDEAKRFPFCTPEGLTDLCRAAEWPAIEIAPIETVTPFDTFELFWHSFTQGAGPAPGYCQSLEPQAREALKAALAERLGSTGPVTLPARAWGVKTV